MVSVIIPCYNRADKIIASAMSVLNQTYHDLELIIVDDGSTDNTADVVSAMEDQRVRYIRQPENMGACAARNRGTDESRGEYIAFQDSDDIWLPDKLEAQVRYMEQHSADLIYCGMVRKDSRSTKNVPEDQKPGDEPSLETLLAGNKISTQTMFMKREVAEKIRFDTSFKRLQDWDFALRTVAAGYRVKYMGGSLVVSEVREDSITARISSEKAYLHLLEKHEKEYEQYPKAKARIYYVIAYRYKGIDNKKVKKYLWKSNSTRMSLQTVIRLLMSYLGIWK